MTTIRTVLFDLDGTLADTAPDLAFALNRLLEEQGYEPLPFETIRPVVSHGGIALIRLGFRIGENHPDSGPLRERLLEIYRGNLTRGTRLFPGMAELLETLENSGRQWGVVTNKPAWLTEPLLDELGVARRAAAIVSGDTLAERKPHPAPLLLACRQADCGPEECLYIGDAERDIQAGRNAGMRTLVALFGYLSDGDRPESWGADGLISDPRQIRNWLELGATPLAGAPTGI